MRNLLRFGLGFCLLFIVVGLTASMARAQTAEGQITGVIYDATGAVIPNATVTITNNGTGIAHTAKADSAGLYRFTLVPSGDYTVTATAPSFATQKFAAIHVDPSQTVPLNITLKPASAQQTVEVTSTAPLVQTANSNMTTTVGAATITNTPLNGRNVYNLAFLAPQVTQGMDYRPAAGGQREAGTTYTFNGTDNNDDFSEGNNAATPPLESVGEFTMLTNDMSAEYGRGTGAVISAVGKSGANQFHGVLYEFNRNRSLNSSDFFANKTSEPKPGYVRNQFGGGLGGPIIRDKLFFYGVWDQVTLNRKSNSTALGPSSAEFAALKANASPIAAYYLNKYTPFVSDSLTNCGAGDQNDLFLGCTALVDGTTDPQRNPYLRFDYTFHSGDSLSFIGTWNFETFTDPYGGGYLTKTPVPGISNNSNHDLTLMYKHIFTPNVLNQLTIGHVKNGSLFHEEDANPSDPEVFIDSAIEGGSGWGMGAFHTGVQQEFVTSRWQFQDNLSYVVGRHNMTFGGSINPGNLYRFWDLGGPGFYEFANAGGLDYGSSAPCTAPNTPAGCTPTPASQGNATGNGGITGVNYNDSNFQSDFPYFEEFAIDPRTGQKANAYRHYTYHDADLFMQDDWRATNRLSFQLGLRWDRFDPASEVHDQIAQFKNFNCLTSDLASPQSIACVANARTGVVPTMWNARNGDIGPRFGFAYDLFGDGRTSLRGGYGIYYDRIFDNVWSNGAWNPPVYALLDTDTTSAGNTIFYTNPASAVPSFVPQPDGQPTFRVSIRTMEPHLKDTSGDNWYLGIEHQFYQNFLLRVNYQGSVGRHEPVLMNYNRFDGMDYNKKLSAPQPNPIYTGFNYRADGVNSSYNSLVTEVQKRMANGLQFQFSYTWSKLMDTNSDLFAGSTTQGSFSQPFYYISNSHMNLEKAAGAFDHASNFKFNFSYELPFFSSQNGFAGHVLGGWQLSGFYQGYSGHPIEVFNSRHIFKGSALDANGFPENLGGDYNLDGSRNDHPDYVGSSISAAYATNQSPADGIFVDNNKIGCGFAGQASINTAKCNSQNGVGTPNSLFVNPPGTGVRFGTLGRNVFRSPWFNGMDAALFKNVKVGEGKNLQLRFESFNTLNHPNFDGINTNLNSSGFGKANFLAGTPSRLLQLGVRLTF
ncbi:MAG: carboxypeptidase regulatory-like domain-containing protein [Terriglobales bacterium]